MTVPTPQPLQDVRVLELGGGITTSYSTKLLADAGADVVKVETPGEGDPLRRWTACGAPVPLGDDGALWRYLNTSKRSAALDWEADPGALADLTSWADVVVEGLGPGGLHRADLAPAKLQSLHPALVIVSISPFGLTGPWADRPATEFTLQAWCGSTGFRGTPERPPVSAGGRVGEFIGATFAANATLAALSRARRDGIGDNVDLSLFECMTNTMQIYEWLHFTLMLMERFDRSIEIPSVEPAADGYVGITCMTAQQWIDFAAMIEHPELGEDPELCHMLGRWPRRQELSAIYRPWLAKHTVEEIENMASLRRIPVTRVGNGPNLVDMDHFRERGVFVPNPAGFVQPRVPWQMTSTAPRPFTPAPLVGEHTEEVVAEAAARPRPAVPAPGGTAGADGDGEARLPFQGLRVLDVTTFLAGPIVTHFLAAMGADVVKVEAAQRPDGIRFAGGQRPGTDRPWEYSWLFHGINVNKRDITLDLTRPEGNDLFKRLVAGADVVVENYSPRVMEGFGLGWDELRAVNPDLIMLRMPGFGLDGPWRDRVGFAQTMEMLSGMAWVTGYADGPPITPRGPCDPLAGLHATFALLAAIEHRQRTGEGQLVEVSMIEAALNVTAEQLVEHDVYGRLFERQGNRGPAAAPQNAYACRGEEQWLALAVATDAQWQALCEVLGRPAWTDDPALESEEGRRHAHDQLDEHLAAWCATQSLDEVVEQLCAAGVPAAPVISPPDVVHNPQLGARRFFEEMDHGVTGRNLYSGLPMRLSRGPMCWNRTLTPTLGEHNDEILGGELGLTADELDRLRTTNLIADVPRMG